MVTVKTDVHLYTESRRKQTKYETVLVEYLVICTRFWVEASAVCINWA